MSGTPAQSGNSSRARRVLILTIASLLAIASLAYVGKTLARDTTALGSVGLLANPLLLAAAIALYALSLTLGCRVWWMILQRVAPNAMGAAAHWRIWALTNPTRFIPGRIWHAMSLGTSMRAAGVDPVASLTSIAVHMWLYLVAGTVVLGLLPSEPGARLAPLALVISGVAAATHPRLLRAAISLIARAADQRALEWRGSWATALGFVAADVGVHLLTGFSASLFLMATVALPLRDAPQVIAANAAAFIAGYVSLVPAGLGVREAAMTLLLGNVMTSERAAVAAIVIRLGTTFTELLLALIALGMHVRLGHRRTA